MLLTARVLHTTIQAKISYTSICVTISWFTMKSKATRILWDDIAICCIYFCIDIAGITYPSFSLLLICFPPAQKCCAFPPAQKCCAFPPAQKCCAFPPAHKCCAFPPAQKCCAFPPAQKCCVFPPVQKCCAFPPAQKCCAFPPAQKCCAFPPAQKCCAFPPAQKCCALPPAQKCCAFPPAQKCCAFPPAQKCCAFPPAQKCCAFPPTQKCCAFPPAQKCCAFPPAQKCCAFPPAQKFEFVRSKELFLLVLPGSGSKITSLCKFFHCCNIAWRCLCVVCLYLNVLRNFAMILFKCLIFVSILFQVTEARYWRKGHHLKLRGTWLIRIR